MPNLTANRIQLATMTSSHPDYSIMSLMRSLAKKLSYAVLLLVIVAAPFEHVDEISIFGLFELTNLKLLLGASVAIWGIYWLLEWRIAGQTPAPRTRWLIALLIVWSGLTGVSILNAEASRAAGINFIIKTLAALIAGWAAYDLTRSGHRWWRSVQALVLSASLVTLLAMIDALHIQPIADWLHTFQFGNRFIDIERVAATLAHPNIMALYLALSLPFVLAMALSTTHRFKRVALAGVLIAGTLAILLSLSRGGMIAFASGFTVLGVLAWRAQRWNAIFSSAALVAILLLMFAVQVVLVPRLQVRLTSEGSNAAWYRADYDAPQMVQAAPDESLAIPVTVTNTGLIDWEIEGYQPVNLGYHILCPGNMALSQLDTETLRTADYVIFRSPRTGLPRQMSPGDTAELTVTLKAPSQPGIYWITWDLIQESIAWFSEKGMVPAVTILNVRGDSSDAAPCDETADQPEEPDEPSRLELWSVALRAIREHPVLGIGPMNFQHYYQQTSPEPVQSEINHPHNMYLALLVDLGLPNMLLIIFAVVLLLRQLVTSQPAVTQYPQWIIWAASWAALTAFAVHSLVDTFHYQTPILLTVCIIIGLAVRLTTSVERK